MILTENFATFKGRTLRGEFWKFYLFMMVAQFIMSKTRGSLMNRSNLHITSVLFLAVWVFTMIPVVSTIVRRLNGIGFSGHYAGFLLIPVIGSLWILILLFRPSQMMPNE